MIFPLFLYFDEFEPNNPLGSHRGIAKCGAVNVSIPCLPPEFQSKLDNIFLFSLFNTLDREKFKNDSIFSKIIEELDFLETTGITVNDGQLELQIYFSL